MAQYDIPLRLVTPHMKGQKVKDAQWLLKGNNPFAGLAPYKDGKLDGDYGTLTSQAAKRAKFWLGYPEKDIDAAFGQVIYEYLVGKEKLPKANADRRKARLAAKVQEKTRGEKAFAEAAKHIGYHEEPTHFTNDNMFGRWYGWNHVAWCAIFESYCFAHSGWEKYHYASVEQIYYDAVANRNNLYIVRSPKLGDIVGYKLHGEQFAHTGFFDHFKNSSTLVDLGGNTGPSNISNGGMVMRQDRSTSIVKFYARVG